MTKAAAAQVSDLYRRHAAAWARQRSQTLFEKPWLDRFVSALPPTGAQAPTVLDIGCGSGDPIARHLLQRGCALTGIDLSPELIAMARAQHPQANWTVADMRGLDLGRAFSGILAWNSVFHLTPDAQHQMFAVYAKHAAPGAALMFTSGPSEGERIGTFEGAPLYHASLSPEAYRAGLSDHGFEVLAHIREDPTCGHHTIWLAQKRRDHS